MQSLQDSFIFKWIFVTITCVVVSTILKDITITVKTDHVNLNHKIESPYPGIRLEVR